MHIPRVAEHPSPQCTQITYILDNPRILLVNVPMPIIVLRMCLR